MKKQKVRAKMISSKSCHFVKRIILKTSNYMQMSNVSSLCIENIRCQQLKQLYKLNSPFMHYLSTQDPYEAAKSEKIAKFKMLSFCQKLFSLYQISSCKCSVCLHCVCKVSDANSKSSGKS